MTIAEWLKHAVEQFERANIPSARLDAEVLLCHILGVDRTYLVAHADDSLARTALSHKNGVHPGGVKLYGEQLVLKRLQRQPIAYLIGHKEFYGREFIVNKNVLIPRPETETLVELAKKHNLTGRLIDIGTGSGALGLTLWHELDNITLTLSDISPEALEVAKKNAKKLGVKALTMQESDLLEHWVDLTPAELFDIIVANLPYVDRLWERSPETEHEPHQALFADDGGLALIYELLEQIPGLLRQNGHVLLEADPEQHPAIIKKAATHKLQLVEQRDYALLFTTAQ